ncbi:hypothetical protein BH10ACT11_BH10ACT11_16580 [soil metagenome]
MSFTKQGRPSPAIVVAALALVFAMIGTAVAGTEVARVLTNAKVKTIAKKAADKELRANIPRSHVDKADTAKNATKLGGQPASAYDSSTSTRWASVSANGVIVADENKGIAQANITNPAQGVYCINVLTPAPTGVQATVRFAANFGDIYAEIKPSGASPCSGSQVGIAEFLKSNGDPLSNPFNVVLYSP